tara:strand:- start:742 stop:2319 length:1578 start_codon:yes stop_codon:yes gene_type:complete
MAGQFTPTDASLGTLLEDYNNYVLRPSTEKDLEDNPVVNDRLHETHMNYFIKGMSNQIGSHVAGFFRLRNWKEKSELNNARIRKVFTRAEGDIGIDWDDSDSGQSIKDRFTAALDGSYASAYRLLVNGDEIYEDMKKMTWHVFKQYYNDGRNVNEALGETLTLLYGDTVLERNGGIEFPNGVGLWHDREMMNKHKVTLNEIEEYKINVFHHLIKKTTANGGNITLQFTNDDPEKSDIGKWSEVAQGIVEGGGNVWWGVINDVYTDGYRVVMLAQRGSSDASIEEAGRRMFTTPGSSLPSVEVIGDGYYNDGSGPKPIRLTKEQFFHAIAEAPAAEALRSNMDWWDNQHWLFNKDKNRKYGEPGGAILMRAAEDAGWFTQPGPDMSRKRIEHYIKKRGPGTKHYDQTPRAWSAFGTGFGLDWSKPGRLEMDLLWMPLWKDIQELEGKNPPGYRVTQDELRTLFRNRYRSMFKGRNDPGLRRTFSLYDMFYIMSNSTSIRYQAEEAINLQDLRGLVNVSGYVPGEEE